MKKIGIIGGCGFIGSYITREFLDNNFEVKVSTTNISNKKKYQHLMNLAHFDNLHICELNVLNKKALQEFVTDCDIIIHGGTPFQLELENTQSELIEPTITGTENLLQVIDKTPGIEKVVFIASVAAWNTNFPYPAGSRNANESFDEKSHRFTSLESHPYCKAKFIANQTVEKYIKDHPNLEFEITTVSPVMVMGKSLSNREDSTSCGFQFLIKNKIIPDEFLKDLFENDVDLALVDVEDVSHAIFKAATTKGLHAKDFLLSSESYKVSDVHAMLNHKKPKEEANIVYQNNLAQKDLGVQFRPVELTLNNYRA
ncbi:hypothetical protein SAMN05444483_10638 [Salegentibacter echinorum]|uniref:NAD-dependent epimerase/dehydratase domain-containing protein n=1 Tax=Salegentibacter echinorum TaxID=1073325 RepID=A0A1M5HWY3_SALEC|nr:NAD-dependent epimerase/dehydratase family protein [Salegentibacter echinorum]SHG20474.1 hypothetical protein SAMN05444483_10638 [Salegentibacter echinorum]